MKVEVTATFNMEAEDTETAVEKVRNALGILEATNLDVEAEGEDE